MKKKFNYKGTEITIERTGYGQYTIRTAETSVHCTDSTIWDFCDDDDNDEKMEAAQAAAYRMIQNNL